MEACSVYLLCDHSMHERTRVLGNWEVAYVQIAVPSFRERFSKLTKANNVYNLT